MVGLVRNAWRKQVIASSNFHWRWRVNPRLLHASGMPGLELQGPAVASGRLVPFPLTLQGHAQVIVGASRRASSKGAGLIRLDREDPAANIFRQLQPAGLAVLGSQCQCLGNSCHRELLWQADRKGPAWSGPDRGRIICACT